MDLKSPPSAKITINNGKTLTLKNCTLKGVRGNPGLFNIIDNIEFSNDSSTLRLENSVIIPTSHVRMTGGKIVEVGQNSYIDQRFAPFEFTNRGTMFQKEHETIGGNFGGDFEFNSQSHYDPTTGKTVEIMSGSTIPSGNTIDTGKMPDAIALPQATIGGVATNFNKAIHGASWSIDGQHVAFIHTGDRSLDPGLLRIDAFQPDSNSGAGALVLKYDARSDAAAANPVQISLATTSGEVKFVAFRPKFKSDATGNEYTLALARNNPPSGTPNVQIFKYIPTAGQENERIIAQKKIGTETITGITLASGDVKAMVWDKEGKHLALITDEPKLRIYQYDGVAGQFTEIGSGITCATPSLDGQLFWGREGKKLFYAGKGGENGGDGVYQVFLFSDSGIRNVTDDTTTFTSAPGIRLALHPTEDTLAVSTNGGNDSVVKLLSYDSIGKITDAEGTVTTKGTDKTITGEETVTSLEWEPSGQGLFVVSDDSNASPKIHAYEYDNKAGKLLDDFAQNANFASIVTNKTLVKWAPGALFVGGEGSDGNDRAAVQKMGKKPAVSKTGGETSLSTEHTAIIADFNLESGTWTITGGNNAMRVLEIMHHAVVTIKSGATLHLKNLRLRGLFAPPPNPASKTINLCENLKIEGGGTLKLENVVVEVFGDVRFDRSNAAGDNATIAFTGSNSKIIAPGGFGSFVVGSNWTLDNLGSATGATAGNMTVTFESGTKVESSVSTIKAISSLIPASNIETPSGGSFEFAVQDVRVGAAHAVDMFRQMRERMEGDTSRGMQFSFNLQAGATGIPRQDLPGGDSRDNPQIITVGRDKVLGAQGEGDMTMTGHSKIILGGGDANANVELTRLEAASRSKITIDTDATVVVSGKGTIKLHDASMVLKKGAKFQVGAAATDQIVVDLRNADLTLKEEGSRFTFGSGTHSLLVDQSTINCKKGTIEFNADMDGKAVSDGTVTEISITDSTITGKNDVALIFYKNKVTNGAEAKTTLTLNANKTSGMRVKFGDQVDLLTPEVSDDVEAEQVPMCCCVEKLGTPVNAKNTGAKTKAVTGEMVVVDSDTGKFYGLRPDDLNHHGMQVINNRKKIHIIDKNVRAQYQDVETGEREPA